MGLLASDPPILDGVDPPIIDQSGRAENEEGHTQEGMVVSDLTEETPSLSITTNERWNKGREWRGIGAYCDRETAYDFCKGQLEYSLENPNVTLSQVSKTRHYRLSLLGRQA